jgi:bifunctional non-homologous end joining protein LigD
MNPAYKPMLATLVEEPFDDKRWVFETKWDGFRLMTEKRGHAVRLWSRNGIDVTTRYAVLLSALQKIVCYRRRALRTGCAWALTLPAFAERPQ